MAPVIVKQMSAVSQLGYNVDVLCGHYTDGIPYSTEQ